MLPAFLFDRVQLALALEPMIAAKAKERKIGSLAQYSSVRENSNERKETGRTDESLAKIAGISSNSIYRGKAIQKWNAGSIAPGHYVWKPVKTIRSFAPDCFNLPFGRFPKWELTKSGEQSYSLTFFFALHVFHNVPRLAT